MTFSVRRRTCGRLVCELMGFVVGLPVVASTSAATAAQFAPVAVQSPFPSDDEPEQGSPTGARPAPAALVVSTTGAYPATAEVYRPIWLPK